MIMGLEPCTLGVRYNDEINEVYSPCVQCGHTMLVHPGVHNPALQECAICSLVAIGIRMEEARSPMIHMTVSEEQKQELMSRIRVDDGPVWRSGPKTKKH